MDLLLPSASMGDPAGSGSLPTLNLSALGLPELPHGDLPSSAGQKRKGDREPWNTVTAAAADSFAFVPTPVDTTGNAGAERQDSVAILQQQLAAQQQASPCLVGKGCKAGGVPAFCSLDASDLIAMLGWKIIPPSTTALLNRSLVVVSSFPAGTLRACLLPISVHCGSDHRHLSGCLARHEGGDAGPGQGCGRCAGPGAAGTVETTDLRCLDSRLHTTAGPHCMH